MPAEVSSGTICLTFDLSYHIPLNGACSSSERSGETGYKICINCIVQEVHKMYVLRRNIENLQVLSFILCKMTMPYSMLNMHYSKICVRRPLKHRQRS